ncbi:L-ascorbate metabolism protein UlaG (beta-lactamase superfamily) [Agrobacterium vitis]|nr:L-ascorbate metabolism protein UlaG (beta-lactamase superfamily) [Agrobacterium vitis]MBE1439022.1 L-ascorbate metabolism protein UlaG (beta-lactamase superfamily) [Agrobacterium vitis]
MVKNRYYSGPVSDHFDGTRFYNPAGIKPLGFAAVMRWQVNGQRSSWPKAVELPSGVAVPPKQVQGASLRVTMIGHASMLIQVQGINILTDPVLSERASPLPFAGPKRVIEPGIYFDDLPPIDVVLVTHNHYDHLDIKSLRKICRAFDPLVVTPLGNDTLIRAAVPFARIKDVDWGDHVRVNDDVRLTAEPCHHWSARGVRDRCMALWAAFVISTPHGHIYHIGDTGFHDGINYRAAAEKYGGFRLAILPIGAYEPRWFMRGQHQNPQEAVEGFRLCNAAFAVGHHFGTFQLTDEPMMQPVEHLSMAMAKAGIARERFRPLRGGEVFDVPMIG